MRFEDWLYPFIFFNLQFMLFSVGAKEIDEDAVDEDRVVYQGIDSVLGIRIHRDSSQILNVLQQQATYELKKGQPLVINKKIVP